MECQLRNLCRRTAGRGERSALDVIATRTSVRAYRDCPVGADTVELLLRAAMAAPSAMNRQPWVFVVVDDKALLQNSPTPCNTPRWRHRRRWRSSSARTSPAIRALPATGG
ncbi:MAG: nitroreductase family protein [Alistipes sp.]